MISSAKSSFIAAFADELRRAREYSGVTLAEVAATTYVAREFLEALENGRWEVIPQPYLRGYLYLYAQAVGMNLDKVLQSFDQLWSVPDGEESATLDSASPLLRQPEHIGVTRAKIRAGWFTALTQNRKTAYLVLLAAAAILGTGLYLSRRAQRPRVLLSSFEQTVSEYRQTLRGPLTHLRVFASDSTARMSKADSHQVVVIGLESGVVSFPASGNYRQMVRFQPYDTLVITYDSLACIGISPGGAATVRMAGRDIVNPRSIVGDTAHYVLSEGKLDKSRPEQDSTKAR